MTDSYDPDHTTANNPPPTGHGVPISQRRSGLAVWALVLGVPGLCFAPLETV